MRTELADLAARRSTAAARLLITRACGSKRFTLGLAFCVLLAVAITLQVIDGAYRSEFGGHPDEPAHYVTGLLVRDYIAQGFPEAPMPYAQDYYDHYPKVALGNWPPGFYALQAAWTLPFGAQRTSIMLLMAVVTASLGTVVFATLRGLFNLPTAAAGALFLVTLPLVQWLSARVMHDTAIALLSFLAVVSFGRFLDGERGRDALLFGVFAALSILTKGTGLALALVPPLALLMTGKWHLLKHGSLWGAAAIVVLLAGPWTWAFREATRASWNADAVDASFLAWAIPFYVREWATSIGVVFVPLVLAGVFVTLGTRDRRAAAVGMWPAGLAFVIGLFLLLIITPAGTEGRYLMPAIPITVLFLAAGATALLSMIATWRQPLRIAAMIPFVAIAAWSAASAPSKDRTGYDAVVRSILARDASAHERLLIVSDAVGEGQFIAEMAMNEERPGHVIRRASKVLSSSTWSGRDYRLLVQTPQQLLDALTAERISLLIVDRTVPQPSPHDWVVSETIRTHADRFRLLSRFAATRRGTAFPDGISLYAVVR